MNRSSKAVDPTAIAAQAPRGRIASAASTVLATRSAAGATTRAPRAAGATRAAAKAVSRRDFRVSYVAVRVFVATDMADAIRQAQAAGATDITSISRNE